MSAWYRFTRLMVWLLPIIFLAPFFCVSQVADTNQLRLDKLNKYSHLAAVAIYNWNSTTDIDNAQIMSMIEKLNIQNDDTSEGIIFRHILATATANETDKPRIPVYVKYPLLKKHWNELKEMNAELFSASKAYYIYARAVNDFDRSHERSGVTVPSLRNLKIEALDTGNKTATAIASIWLAMELTLESPIRAINEIEYALPYLPQNSSEVTLENALDRATAHLWLNALYMEMYVPSKAYEHAMKIIMEGAGQDEDITIAYFLAVDSLISQYDFQTALSLSEKAIEYVVKRNSEHETFVVLFQKLKVLLLGFNEVRSEEVLSTFEQLSSFDIKTIELKSLELANLFRVYKAIITDDKAAFELSVKNYEQRMKEFAASQEFSSELLLRKELELTRIYDAAGDYQKAYEHSKAYDQILFEKNTKQFKFSSSSFTDGIAKDIELAHYRQKELASLREQKEGLSTDKEAMKTTIFVLLLTILLILVLWLWVAKKQSDLLAERDSLTGALTRRAMLNSLKKSLRGDKTSSIALLDVDNFKKINDRYGHAVGDEVLTTITQIIKNRIRKSDKLCRYGGEEFLIYFSDTDEKSAKRILEELNVALSRQKHWNGTDEKFCVSFSSGLLDVNGETNLDRIIKACDDLLYKAKRDGRARVASLSF